jgi:hypothetical protein
MASPPRADRQTTIRLPNAIHERLSHEAELRGSSVGEEIRRRLVASFEAETSVSSDPRTRALVGAIARMADTLGDWFGPWHEDAAVEHVFRYAVSKLLILSGPREQPEPLPPLRPKPGSLAAELFTGKIATNSVTSALVARVQGGDR